MHCCVGWPAPVGSAKAGAVVASEEGADAVRAQICHALAAAAGHDDGICAAAAAAAH
jgi:hypothetical protein